MLAKNYGLSGSQITELTRVVKEHCDEIEDAWKMKQELRQHAECLKSVLLSLPATGETGFEGLIGATLREITGVPFRLASSGSQHGVDGNSAYEKDAICFEGKRYDGRVSRAEVLSKIAELSIRDTQTDIWVLGATSQIASQLADDARDLGTRNGIHVLILDWSATDLPPLAVALAMGRTRANDQAQSPNTKRRTRPADYFCSV